MNAHEKTISTSPTRLHWMTLKANNRLQDGKCSIATFNTRNPVPLQYPIKASVWIKIGLLILCINHMYIFEGKIYQPSPPKLHVWGAKLGSKVVKGNRRRDTNTTAFEPKNSTILFCSQTSKIAFSHNRLNSTSGTGHMTTICTHLDL